MSYLALYRKYRPQNFDEIVGQKAIVTTLKNQIKNGKIGHAYLFCGMRGTGKTSTARVFAKALNCEKGPTENPCNLCPYCNAINSGSMMDVIEMDAASNRGIDDIRELREKVNFAPSEGRYKIYIIDEVHMLTTEAFNALLKTLEEPPGYVVFILATTEPNKLPATILSRCMRFDFIRVSTPEIVSRLKEIATDVGIEVDEKALVQIAAYSQGSVRDSLSLLDKAMAFSGENISYDDILTLMGSVNREVFYEISQAIMQKNSGEVLDILDQVASQGKDLFRFLDDLLEHFRNLLMTRIDAERSMIDVIDDDYIKLQKIAQGYNQEKLLLIIDILNTAANDVKWSSQPRIVVESALVKLTLPTLWDGPQGYESRIQELETQISILRGQLKNVPNGGFVRTDVADTGKPAILHTKESEPISKEPTQVITEPIRKRVLKEEKSSASTQKHTQNDKEVLAKIQKSWPNIVDILGEKRKMVLQTVIKTGNIRPVKVENTRLYFLNDGDKVFEEKVEAEKHIIEEIIKDITGFDLVMKGFAKSNVSSKETLKQPNTANKKIEKVMDKVKPDNISDEEFDKSITDFFGEEIVTFED